MNHKTTAAALALVATIGVTGCTSSEYEQRKQQQTKAMFTGDSLEEQNLAAKVKRENNAARVGYVYLVNFGKPFGYYVIKGKVSSSGSQVGPEQEVIKGIGGEGYVLDSRKDDGTYGAGDPGIFFFLADGTMVETTLDYIYSEDRKSVV